MKLHGFVFTSKFRWALLSGVLLSFMPWSTFASTDCEIFNSSEFFANADLESVKACLDVPEILMKIDSEGQTPLHHAVRSSPDALVIDLLLEELDDYGIKDVYLNYRLGDRTIAHVAAAESADPAILVALAKHGINVTTTLGECGPRFFSDGCVYPLHLAAARNDGFEFMAALLALNAEKLPQDNNNNSLQEIIEKSGEDTFSRLSLLGLSNWPDIIAQHFSEYTDLSTVDSDQESCRNFLTEDFFRSATLQAVMTCIASGSSPLAVDSRSNSAIHLAAQSTPDPAVIDFLLHVISTQDSQSVARVLRQTNSRVFTPLHLASESNSNPEVVARLIAWGANVNHLGGTNQVRRRFGADLGVVPLHLAARRTDNMRELTLTVLLAAGADMRMVDHNGYSAIHLAAQNRPEIRIIELLQQADIQTKGFLQSKVSELTDNQGNTALHYAVARNADFGTIRSMVSFGFTPDALNRERTTPLLLTAQQHTDPEVFFHLLDKSPRPCHQDSQGRTIEGLLRLNTVLSNFDVRGEARSPLSAYKEKCPD